MNTSTTCPERVSAIPSPPERTTRTSTSNRLTNVSLLRQPVEPEVVTGPLVVEPKAEPPSSRRRLFFRCARLMLTGAVLAGVGAYARHTFNSATSEQAYINAEMTVLRAPIEGQLRLEPVQPGARIVQGATLFRVENPRFGNQEAMAQSNWLRELTERLQAEAGEAAVRCQKQEQVYRLHEKLHEEKLISRLGFLEEETKLALARTALSTKQVQARQAEARTRDVEHVVALRDRKGRLGRVRRELALVVGADYHHRACGDGRQHRARQSPGARGHEVDHQPDRERQERAS